MSIWQNKDILGVITENFVYPHEWKNFALINKTCYQVFTKYIQNLRSHIRYLLPKKYVS